MGTLCNFFAIIATFYKSIIVQNKKVKRQKGTREEVEERKEKKQLGMNTDNSRDERRQGRLGGRDGKSKY